MIDFLESSLFLRTVILIFSVTPCSSFFSHRYSTSYCDILYYSSSRIIVIVNIKKVMFLPIFVMLVTVVLRTIKRGRTGCFSSSSGWLETLKDRAMPWPTSSIADEPGCIVIRSFNLVLYPDLQGRAKQNQAKRMNLIVCECLKRSPLLAISQWSKRSNSLPLFSLESPFGLRGAGGLELGNAGAEIIKL